MAEHRGARENQRKNTILQGRVSRQIDTTDRTEQQWPLAEDLVTASAQVQKKQMTSQGGCPDRETQQTEQNNGGHSTSRGGVAVDLVTVIAQVQMNK